jgi:hypothetical protein
MTENPDISERRQFKTHGDVVTHVESFDGSTTTLKASPLRMEVLPI